VPVPTKDGTQTLILVHRRELVEQAARHCLLAYPHKSIEIEMGTSHATGLADITVASIASISRKDRMNKFDPQRFKLVLVDEAHHIVASTYTQALSHFGLDNPCETSPALVGVSATMSRFDGLRLGAAIDHIVYHKDYVDMIGEKWLSDVIFTTVKSHADISRVKSSSFGDFQFSQLSRAVNTDETNEITVRSWLARAAIRKSTLVFCVDLAHVSNLTNTFRRHGIDAQFITGDTPKHVRGERLDDFRNRKFPVLLNCGVFTEGTDIPNIDCVVLARPTKSRNLLVQMIGRGMRLYPGKADCHVIDMVASLDTGIVTTPTLFGLDPSELVQEADVQKLRETKERKQLELQADLALQDHPGGVETSLPAKGNVTFVDYDSVQDLIDDTSGERHIRGLSPHAWVHVDEDRYILSSKSGDYLTIIKTSQEEFEVKRTARLPEASLGRSPWARTRVLARTKLFSDAVHAADTLASKLYERIFIVKAADWRKRPASDGQLEFLNRLREPEDQLTANDISKGKAGDMITKIKHGARGRFNRYEEAKRRQGREQERVETLRRREEVKVGPLEMKEELAGSAIQQ
jgi:ATP-dependent helicase IRC3